jgi:CBS domain-containing protein
VRFLSEKYLEAMLRIPVEKSMRLKPLTVSKLDSVSSLVIKMVRENIGAAVVIENDHPVGIITEKDVLERVVIPEKNMHRTLAGDIMSKPLITIETDRSIKEALEIMKKNDVRRLVVTKDTKVIGLVSERRLLEIISRY